MSGGGDGDPGETFHMKGRTQRRERVDSNPFPKDTERRGSSDIETTDPSGLISVPYSPETAREK